MNIAILSYEYPPDTGFGGIGTYAYYHARALAKLGHRVHVFAGATTVGAFESEHDGVRVTRLKIEGWLHRLLAPARRRRCFWFNNRVETAYAQYVALRRTLDRERFDIVEAPECGADASLISLLSSIPVAVRFHSPARLIMDTYDTPPLDRRLTPIVERIAMSRARVRTACSQYVANEVAAKIGVPEPIHVIPNGIDLDVFDAGDGDAGARFGLPDGGLTVFFANRLERRKGIHVVAEVAERILPRYSHVRFVLAGRDLFGYVAGTVLPRIRALGVEDRFHVLGGVELADVRALLKRTDIFLLPSLWENCPYSAIEAMSAGRAIVSSDCGGMPELIADGDNGLLARTGDVDAFVARLEELIESKDRRERLGAAARATVEARLTDVDIARRTLELYDATLSAGQHVRIEPGAGTMSAKSIPDIRRPTGPTQPGSLSRLMASAPRHDLRTLSLADLSKELLARLSAGETYVTSEQVVLGDQLAQLMAAALDIHENRFAARRYRDLLDGILPKLKPGELQGATVVDLGCGSLNPFTFGFLLLMLGAERAYAIDLERVQDMELATRALAAAASWLLLDPGRIVPSQRVGPEEVLRNLRGFQLPLLSRGNPSGIAADRLLHRLDAVEDLGLADGEADAVFSVSLLEHLGRLDEALASIRRITKPGGLGLHVIDFTDHRVYDGTVTSPFEFLREKSSEPLVHGCNRIRCDQFRDLFQRHGFVVEQVERWEPSRQLTAAEQRQFAEPFRAMDPDNVRFTGARYLVRRTSA